MDLSNTIIRWLNDFTAQGILTTDAELKICGWNRWLEICSGRSAAQMFGRDLLEAYPELVERRLDSFYQQALAGQVVMLSHRFHRYLLPMPVQTNRAGFQQMQQAARIAPLLEGERVVGTITVIEDVTERAVREEEFKRQIAVQDALHEIDRAILSLDLDNCLRRVVEKTAALVGAPIAAVVLREGEGLRVGACVGGACDTVLQANTAGSIAAWAAESRQALLLADVAAARDTGALRPLVPGSRSVVAAPLLVENQVIGTLVVESPRPNAFSEAEQELVIALATQAAVAIYNARLYSALRESEARFRSIFENATIGLYRTTPDGRILLANPALIRVLGCDSFEELTTRDLEQAGFEPTYPRSQFKERIERDGEIRSLESAWLRRDGSTVFVRESAKAIRDADGAILYYEGTVEDVTERQRAEDAEREQRLLAEALRDAATALASTLSLDEVLDRILAEVGRVMPHDTANVMFIEDGIARIARHRGYAERQQEAAVQALRFPVAEVANLRQMIETGQPCTIPDTRSYSAWMDIPETRWVRSYAGVPICSKGQTIGFLNLNSATPGFFTETHVERLQAFADQAAVAIENARLYEKIRRHAAELEQRVAERTAELEAANRSLREAAEKLKELNQVKSQFVSNVSHELRTPLTNIKTYLYLLEKGKPEKREQYMGTLHREAELLHQLIEDLLHISRLDLGKAQPALAAVDLNRLVTLLVEDRSIMFSKRGLTLEVRAAPALPPVLADARMLTQVLTNLMTNAMNYTPAGGTVTVRTALQEPPYPIPNTQSQWVTLSVTDTGPGISPEDQAHLFERFYRGEAARQTAAPGTGLGLAICHEIVQRHGGQITVESEVGKGSTFTVWLPAVDDKVTG